MRRKLEEIYLPQRMVTQKGGPIPMEHTDMNKKHKLPEAANPKPEASLPPRLPSSTVFPLREAGEAPLREPVQQSGAGGQGLGLKLRSLRL